MGHFIPLFGVHLEIAVMLEGRGREARTDWSPGVVLSGHLCKEPERASMTITERSKVVDKVSNSAGHE